MAHDYADWRIRLRRAVLALTAAALPLAYFDGAVVQAQSIMRSPNLNIGSRIPSISPTVTRIAPNIAGRAVTIGRTTPRLNARMTLRPGLPYLRYSPNLYPVCDYDANGECLDRPLLSADGGGNGASAKRSHNGPRRDAAQTALNLRTIAGELVAEIDGSLSDAQTDELARRHGLARLESRNFPLVGGTIGLFRITDRRTVDAVSREFGAEASVRSVQPNFRYLLQDQQATLTEDDPLQYALGKLRLPAAHRLARGANVTVAVIDSGIDAKHPELANAIVDSFDALGSKQGPHAHGTGVAGAIVSHARLVGSAPAARILAIRAFGVTSNGAESSSFVVLKGLDYAAAHGAEIVNMSFAGPKDAMIERGVAALAAKGMVMVAAAGNAGPKSPPLFPAAYAGVIAVSATDAQDRLFAASNRGGYIAIAAPGVDIFLPAPDEKYQMTSGTSFSAAFMSGLAALLLERDPALKADELRAVLMKTARDLGALGRDDLFGAGEADAFAAVSAVVSAPAVPVAVAPEPPASEKLSGGQDVSVTRALNEATPAMAPEKSAAGQASRPDAQ
jgi:hypothetical protein